MRRNHLTIAAALSISLGACSQSAGIEFAEIDANADNFISQNEAQAYEDVAANFNAADSNADGSLSEQEFQLAFNVPPPPLQSSTFGGSAQNQ